MAKLRIQDILKESNVSKRRFAKMLGIDYSNVFRYFRKDYDPKLSTLEQWAKVLGIQIGDLYHDIKAEQRKNLL